MYSCFPVFIFFDLSQKRHFDKDIKFDLSGCFLKAAGILDYFFNPGALSEGFKKKALLL